MSIKYITEITGLFRDEFKANIMFVLDMFGPLDLKSIHKLLKKPKSTILGHLQKMVELKQIEIDEKISSSKKKFYSLSLKTREIFDEEDEIILKQDTLSKAGLNTSEFVKSIANVQRTIGFQSNLIANLSANYLESNVEFFNDLESNKEKLRGFWGSTYELGINSEEDFKEIYSIIKEMSDKLKKFDKSKRKRSKETMLMFTISCPKERIGPQ